MENNIEEEVLKLKGKINKVFTSEDVHRNGDELSVYDVYKACKNQFSGYNKIFVTDEKKLVDKLNRKIKFLNFFESGLPLIGDFCPGIDSNGDKHIDVLFKDYSYRYKGKAVIDDNFDVDYILLRDEFNENRILKILKNYECKEEFNDYFKALDIFQEEFPNCAFEWNNNDKNSKAVFSDGFMESYLYLDNLYEPYIGFVDIKDTLLARYHSQKYSELYDFVDYYKLEILRKMRANINDLNDVYKAIVQKELNEKENKVKKLVL